MASKLYTNADLKPQGPPRVRPPSIYDDPMYDIPDEQTTALRDAERGSSIARRGREDMDRTLNQGFEQDFAVDPGEEVDRQYQQIGDRKQQNQNEIDEIASLSEQSRKAPVIKQAVQGGLGMASMLPGLPGWAAQAGSSAMAAYDMYDDPSLGNAAIAGLSVLPAAWSGAKALRGAKAGRPPVKIPSPRYPNPSEGMRPFAGSAEKSYRMAEPAPMQALDDVMAPTMAQRMGGELDALDGITTQADQQWQTANPAMPRGASAIEEIPPSLQALEGPRLPENTRGITAGFLDKMRKQVPAATRGAENERFGMGRARLPELSEREAARMGERIAGVQRPKRGGVAAVANDSGVPPSLQALDNAGSKVDDLTDDITDWGDLDPNAADNMTMVDDTEDMFKANGSGDSDASIEALSRQAGMRARGEEFVVQKGGTTRKLIGPDAVDYQPQAGEVYGIMQNGQFRPLSHGSARGR